MKLCDYKPYCPHLSCGVVIISVKVLLESLEHIVILVPDDLPGFGSHLSLTPSPPVVIIDHTNIAVHRVVCEVLSPGSSAVSTTANILETKYFLSDVSK